MLPPIRSNQTVEHCNFTSVKVLSWIEDLIWFGLIHRGFGCVCHQSCHEQTIRSSTGWRRVTLTRPREWSSVWGLALTFTYVNHMDARVHGTMVDERAWTILQTCSGSCGSQPTRPPECATAEADITVPAGLQLRSDIKDGRTDGRTVPESVTSWQTGREGY